jgi:Domain of unknown function (DUF1905)/Bacteriocin-protection, YdeI or OmpD-Associated
MRFSTTLLQGDKTATGIEVPPEVVESLGAGKRPKVYVTINGYTYRSSIAVMGGRFMVGVSAENRAGAKVSGGDAIDVDLRVDNDPRTVDVPAELASELDAHPAAKAKFAGLSYSNQLRLALSITTAKTPETLRKRIDAAVAELGS